MIRRNVDDLILPLTYQELSSMSTGTDIEVILCAPKLNGAFFLGYDNTTVQHVLIEGTGTSRGICKKFEKFKFSNYDSKCIFHLEKISNDEYKLYRKNTWGLMYAVPTGTTENCLIQVLDNDDKKKKFVGANNTSLIVTEDPNEAIANDAYHWDISNTAGSYSFSNFSQGVYFYNANSGSNGTFSLRSGTPNGGTWNVSGDDKTGFIIYFKKGNAAISNGSPTSVSTSTNSYWWFYKVDNIHPNRNGNESLWDNNDINVTIDSNIHDSGNIIAYNHDNRNLLQIHDSSSTNYSYSHDNAYSATNDGNSIWYVFRVI